MKTTFSEHVAPSRAVRLPRVCELTGASRSTVWRWVNCDQTFPKPFHLSSAITCWDECEILDWIGSKKTEQRAR